MGSVVLSLVFLLFRNPVAAGATLSAQTLCPDSLVRLYRPQLIAHQTTWRGSEFIVKAIIKKTGIPELRVYKVVKDQSTSTESLSPALRFTIPSELGYTPDFRAERTFENIGFWITLDSLFAFGPRVIDVKSGTIYFRALPTGARLHHALQNKALLEIPGKALLLVEFDSQRAQVLYLNSKRHFIRAPGWIRKQIKGIKEISEFAESVANSSSFSSETTFRFLNFDEQKNLLSYSLDGELISLKWTGQRFQLLK